jgi:hypothetical protein
MMLTADAELAIATLPALVPPDAASWALLVNAVRTVASASGPPGAGVQARLERLAAMAPDAAMAPETPGSPEAAPEAPKASSGRLAARPTRPGRVRER